MDMGDGSSFIDDEFNHPGLFDPEGEAASGFDWADDIISSLEGEERSTRNPIESSIINNQSVSANVQFGQASSTTQQFSQSGPVNVQLVQNTSSTIQQVQQIPQQPQQTTQLLPNLANLTQGGGQLIQGLNGQLFLKPLPNGQFQLSTQPQIQQVQHPQQSSSPIPIQPHPHGSPHVNQSPIPVSSPHVGSSSSSPHVNRSLTPIQQSRQYGGIPQNVNMLQVQGTGSQSQPQIIRNVPINTQISNISNFQPQVLQSQGHNQGQNFVNTQNTVIQNPNVVNVNVAHVLCPNPQFQGQQQGQGIQGTLIQTADGKHIIIPNAAQLPSNNQIQIQNLPQMAIQPQINVVPTSSSSGTTPLVQGGQVVENNAAALGGLGYIRIATPTSSSQQEPPKVQQQTTATHFLGLNSQGQQILIQRTPTPGQNIVLRQVAPQIQIPQQQNPPSSQILPQTSQTTQQILLPQVQRIVASPQNQQQVKLVAQAPAGNLPMTINIGGQNVILPGNLQQLIQPQVSQLQKTSTGDNVLQNRQSLSSITTTSSVNSNRLISTGSVMPQPVAASTVVNNVQLGSNQSAQGQTLNSQVPTFLLSAVNSSTASMTPVTTTVSQTRQVISNVNISNSPKMYQVITSVVNSVTSTVSTQQKPFLSAVTNAPKLPTATIQLTPQAQQQIQSIQNEIRKLKSLKDPTDHQKQQLVQLHELQKQIIAKGQIKLHPVIQPQQVQQTTNIQSTSNVTTPFIGQPVSTSFIGQPALSLPQTSQVVIKQLSSSSPLVTHTPSQGNVQSQLSSGLPAQGLVTSDNSFSSTCPTKSVQSQHGSIMSISPTGNKSIQQPIIVSQAQSSSTSIQSGSMVVQGQVLVQGQQGTAIVQNQQSSVVVQGQQGPMIVQGQSGTLRMGVQNSVSTASSESSSNTCTTNIATTSKVLPNVLQGKLVLGTSQQTPVPTQIKIANHILTLHLTPDQKEKVQGYLSKMTPEQQQHQMALFLKLQHQQKMNAQVQAQVQQQKKLQAQSMQPGHSVQSQLPVMVQQSQSVPSSTSGNIINIEQPNVSPSKPNVIQRLSVDAIPKHQLIHQQQGKDQANALNPDTASPFKNDRDTYRRLLRYHVFKTKDPPDDLVKKDDDMFDDLSEGLVRKKNWMFEKYRYLLLEESMREQPTAEIMMIQKMMNEDLKETLEDEKQRVKRNPESFEIMPRKYLKLEHPSDTSEDVKFNPDSITVKTENDMETPIAPSLIKKESIDSDGSRPSTPKLKLVIKSDGQGYSSTITEEEMEHCGSMNLTEIENMTGSNFMSSINVKEEPVEIDDNLHNVPLDDGLKPFQSYSHIKEEDSYNLHSLNDSNDLDDTGADSNSDITVVSDDENRMASDTIVIDDEDEEENSNEDSNLGLQDHEEADSPKNLRIDPVMKHEDISTDFTDYFSNTESAYYSHTGPSHDLTSDVISSFPSSGQISNDNVSYSQNSDALSTQTIPYSDDGNSVKDEDLSNDIDYNKSTSSFAQYEPISSPEADQEESSFSKYLSSYKSTSAFNLDGIRDQNINYDLSNSTNNAFVKHENDHLTENTWNEEAMEEGGGNSDNINAEVESAINSILSLS